MDVKIIDNFLDAYAFHEIQKTIVYNPDFELFLQPIVAFDGKDVESYKVEEENKWNFYFIIRIKRLCTIHHFYGQNHYSQHGWQR